MPRAGLEPAQSHDHEILSLARIPISPPRPLTSLVASPSTRPSVPLPKRFVRRCVSRLGRRPRSLLACQDAIPRPNHRLKKNTEKEKCKNEWVIRVRNKSIHFCLRVRPSTLCNLRIIKDLLKQEQFNLLL